MFTSNVEEEEIKDFYKNISKNVRKYTTEKKMSQLELSLTIGQKGNASYNYAENNTNNKHFNLEHLYKISKALEVDMCEFIKTDNLSSL
jgi:transcriptional regulator with XRE-family HTH domain